MRPFLLKFSSWLIIPILFLIIFEIYLRIIPTSFKLKYNSIEKQKNNINVLILGSSHNQNAINPEWLDYKSINLAFGGQDFHIDYEIFKKYIDEFPKLDAIIFDLSYFSLEDYISNNPRKSLYSYYYGLNFDSFSLFKRQISKKSILLGNPSFFLKNIDKNLSIKINDFGFTLDNNVNNPFYNLKYDTLKIFKKFGENFMQKHNNENLDNYELNVSLIIKMINYCQKHKIMSIFIAPPVTDIYYKGMLPSKKKRRDKFAKRILEEYPGIVYYMDFESDPNFKFNDFRDFDHLNINGARKFSNMLNDTLQMMLTD